MLKAENTYVLRLSDKGLKQIRHNIARRLASKVVTHQKVSAQLSANLCAFISAPNNNNASFDSDSVKIILDTGASAGFTHCLGDFISFRSIKGEVSGLGKHQIHGIGTVKYDITNDKGIKQSLTVKDVFYVPTIKERLLSPQQIAQQYSKSGVSCYVGDGNCFQLYWGNNCKTISLNKSNNLPIMHTAPGTSNAKAFHCAYSSGSSTPQCFRAHKTVEHYPKSSSSSTNKNAFPAESIDFQQGPTTKDPTQKINVKCKSDCPSCHQVLPDGFEDMDLSSLENMTPDQRFLLHWHIRLGHLNWKDLQKLARQGFLGKKNRKLANIDPPACVGCLLGKSHRLPKGKGSINKSNFITPDKPGDLISTDQAETSQPGRHHTHSGHNISTKINTFTIYYDSISKLAFVHFQTSTGATETLEGKHRFERYAHQRGVSLRNFRADNGVFKSAAIRMDLKKNNQDVTFSAVGAKHQNGIAERFIRTVTEKARAALLHAASFWPDKMIPVELWTHAVKHVVHTHNHTPRADLNFLSPEEVFSGLTQRSSSRSDNMFRYFHPFGCPAYVLDSRLSDGKRIPKWDPRCRTGIFLGYSDEHAGSVSLVLNPDTDRISAQYNVIHDDKFQTCTLTTNFEKIEAWNEVWRSTELSIDDFDFEVPVSDFQQSSDKSTLPDLVQRDDDDIPPLPAAFQRETSSSSKSSPSEGAPILSDYDNEMSHRAKDLSSFMQPKPPPKPRTKKQYNPTAKRKPVPGATRRSSRKAKSRKLFHAHLQKLFDAASPSELESYEEKMERILYLSSVNDEVNDYEPHALVASANPNILGHRDAMKADDFEKFLDSMDDEIERLFKEGIVEVVPRSEVPTGQKVLRAVWSHRRKTTPEGVIYRHRSRICADGSQQTHGLDYKETYAPVVNWTTVRILLILSLVFGYKSRQVDYVQAFPQASLSEEEKVFMEIPPGFRYEGSNSSNYVLRLRKNLYGLKQAAYNWNVMLTEGLKQIGFTQSKHDPCLFFKENIVCVIYVDDTIFFSKNDALINQTIKDLQDADFVLTDEGQVDAFLGIRMQKQSDGSIKMTQPHLISTILALVGIEQDTKESKGSKPLSLPAVNPPLHKHANGPERERKWSYRSAIGLLTYLARNTRPDIEYAVHQCARFQSNPKKAHENAVMRIARYLKGTAEEGLIMKPDGTKLNELEVYVDADFAGAYSKEINDDPSSVRSRTGCVILFADCPIHWFSRLQTEIALSTTEAEYMALSTAAREALPLRELMLEITSFFKIPEITPTFRCTIFEDNKGAEQLAKCPKIRPRTKHIAIKYHHFREAVRQQKLIIKRVDTDEQRADILTKATPIKTLTHLRKQIQGWTSILTKINPFSEGVVTSSPVTELQAPCRQSTVKMTWQKVRQNLCSFLAFMG